MTWTQTNSFYSILLLLGVYFAGFFLFNRFILKKRGKEQLPPMGELYAFLNKRDRNFILMGVCVSLGPSIVDAWTWVKDMSIIGGVVLADKVRGLMGRSRAGGFQGLPSDDH